MVNRPNNSKGTLRAAQILLSDRDRDQQRRLQSRLTSLGTPGPGPTLLFRAGLLALLALDDDRLRKTLDDAADKPNKESILEQFQQWCRRISRAIGAREPALEFAHEGDRGGQLGYFSNQGRFVHFSLTDDGRVLASGLQAITEPVAATGRVPRAPVLFPGGLAVLLSMNAEGSELAERAVTTWLLWRDGQLEDVRAAFRRHNPSPLR